MSDLISRSALLEKARNYYPSIDHYCLSEKAVPLNAVKAAPAVDAVEVVHGRWIPADGEGETSCDEWDCSICKRRLTFGEEMEIDEVYELNHYCPNCGAKMEGKDE